MWLLTTLGPRQPLRIA